VNDELVSFTIHSRRQVRDNGFKSIPAIYATSLNELGVHVKYFQDKTMADEKDVILGMINTEN
jgi:hypothetical protein